MRGEEGKKTAKKQRGGEGNVGSGAAAGGKVVKEERIG